jgi:hypothetical protein
MAFAKKITNKITWQVKTCETKENLLTRQSFIEINEKDEEIANVLSPPA